MSQPLSAAPDDWQRAWSAQQDAALVSAFPGLERMPPPTGCCDSRMRVERAGEAAGTVCFDDHGRVTIDFTGIPQQALGHALDTIFGPGWFGE
ncbi:hypothetical protein ACIGDI_34395 [Streptomyces sp. NPDC085900]|uniref:hypothetical protein n=1 Tax=Streptomyces sp. NPDC085900 TaxID=3365737 RepID=UPI0037CDA1FC